MKHIKYSSFTINPVFPGITFSSVEGGRGQCLPHFHLDFDFSLVTDGILELSIGNKKYYIHKGQISMMNPGITHCGSSVSNSSFSVKNIRISREFIREACEYLDLEYSDGIYFLDKPVVNSTISKKFELFYDEATHNGTFNTVMVAELGWEVITLLLTKYSSIPSRAKKKQTENITKIKTDWSPAIKIMHTRIGDSIKLTELAKSVHLSEYYFVRKFKKELGLTPHQYLTQLRVETAFGLLRQGSSCSDVAVECGFSDQPHMNRLLKEHYGYTPKKIQQIVASM